MEDQTLKVLAAIVGLVVLECVAMFCGINGTVLRLVVIAVAGLAGFTLRPIVEKAVKSSKK